MRRRGATTPATAAGARAVPSTTSSRPANVRTGTGGCDRDLAPLCGRPLVLSVHAADAATHDVVLGDDLAAGQVPQAVVPADAWQAAEPRGAWTLVGGTVSPGFTFEGFELAPPGWSPP